MTVRRLTSLIATILCLCALQSYCFAQDKTNHFGKLSTADFSIPSNPIIDTNTNAVVLADVGTVHFVGNKHSWFSWMYKRQTRIKILNKNAIDLSTRKILLYNGNDDGEKLSDIVATTYNLSNGQIAETRLDKQDIFSTRIDKNWTEIKFTLPAVKEGSIIEFTYTETSPYAYNLPSWAFQSDQYPCLWSEYQVSIPQALFYVVVREGVHGYTIDKGSEGNESYTVTQKDQSAYGSRDQDLYVDARTTKHQWAMKDIPALHAERYLYTPANYLDRLEFQLSKTYNGSESRDETNSWAKATDELLEKENFGAPLAEDNEWLNDLVSKATTGSASEMQQARAIYYYISSHFTCTDHYDKYITSGLRNVVKKNSGTVGDINLLLAAVFRLKGWKADPVVLSTRDFGYNLSSYPVLARLNYVIVRLKLGDKIWYLDASHPDLGFGQLPGDCYNGHARIISKTDSASIYFEADSLKETRTTMVLMTNTGKGMEGNFQTTFGDQESYNFRQMMIKKDEKEYFKETQASFGDDLTLSNGRIDSLSAPELPVKLHYDFVLNNTAGASVLYINPMLWNDLRRNPFTAAERKYPVEMPYTTDEVYIFSMEIPEGYAVDEMPKSAKVAFNGDQGMFEYLLEQQGAVIRMRCRLRLNKAWFPAEDYASLRDFLHMS
ncbi:DUF3857 domain-containing protein [Puia sp. P3]|uniref:DUF3857 domain-containing protein n=1 Tax=Puia sp. P3 TaxID=3423952 RepID=UPI003D67E626